VSVWSTRFDYWGIKSPYLFSFYILDLRGQATVVAEVDFSVHTTHMTGTSASAPPGHGASAVHRFPDASVSPGQGSSTHLRSLPPRAHPHEEVLPAARHTRAALGEEAREALSTRGQQRGGSCGGERMAETTTSKAACIPSPYPRGHVVRSTGQQRSRSIGPGTEEGGRRKRRSWAGPFYHYLPKQVWGAQILVLLLEEKQKFEPRKIRRSSKSKIAALIWMPLLELL
jgi:hypothetical protein